MKSLTYEYQIGDRVRALAGVDGIPEGTKGNVVYIKNDTLHVKAKVNDNKIVGLFAPDQLEQVRASTGDFERTRRLYNIDYAGTNLPEELIQVWQHIDEMMCVGYSYLYMEKHLMSLGFGLNMIRRAFKKLTGIRAEDAVNFDYQFSPGNIPQFTLGWGFAKNGKGTCFIMPGVNWYSIMLQTDDLTRIEIGKFYTLPEAIEEMKKTVKEFQQWNPPVNELKIDKKHKPQMDMSQMYKQPQLFMEASGKLLNLLRNTASAMERAGLINEAYLSGTIGEESRDSLKRVFADAEAIVETDAALEKLDDVEQDAISRPIQEEISEKTPGQFFEKKKMERRYSMLPADVIASVSEYISNANAHLKDFELGVHSFKYSTIQPAGTKQSTPGDEPDIMNAIASVSVLLELMDKKSGAANKKLGLMVFSVIQNNIYTTDTIKGEDDWIYAVSDEGLGKYFQAERELAVQKS